jgi:hypothetical protein
LDGFLPVFILCGSGGGRWLDVQIDFQTRGLRQRSPGNRAKSLSDEQSSAPCSIASAAMRVGDQIAGCSERQQKIVHDPQALRRRLHCHHYGLG